MPCPTTEWSGGPEGGIANPAGTWTYGYDSAGRNTSLVSPAGTSSISYDNNGWQAGRVLPNGITETISYKNNGAYSAFSNKTSGGTTLNSFTSPTYDGVFNLKSFTSSVPAYTNFSGTTNFGYDTKDRLTSEASTGRTPSYSNSFGYDNAGNPTTFKGATRTFNTNNQSTTTGYTYNANGNPTTYGGITLAYDPENRMTSFGSAMSATYRADNLRASKANSSGTTLFYYDIDGEPVLETGSTGTVTAINVYASDGLVGRQSGGTWTYYGFDQQGNVALRSDSSGAVTSYGCYDAYGVEWNSVAPPSSDPFGYNAQWGYRFDRETGLYYCQNRYYDASAGRWLTRDPIGPTGGINTYSYTSAGPIGRADRLGLQQGGPLDEYSQGWARFFAQFQEKIARAGDGWGHALSFLGDFFAGSGKSKRTYSPGSTESVQVAESIIGDQIREDIQNHCGCPRGTTFGGSVDTIPAFLNTLKQPWNGTQAQLGGVGYKVVMDGQFAEVTIYNKAGLNSFLYHVSKYFISDYPREKFRFLGDINQEIRYDQPIHF